MDEIFDTILTEPFDDQIKIIVPQGKEYQVSRSAIISNSRILHSMIEELPQCSFPFIQLSLADENIEPLIQTIEGKEPFLESVKNAKEMYILSKIYYIEKLETLCRDYLIKNINNDNVSYIHDFACEQNDTLIQYYCWEKFDRDWERIFKQEDFLHCKQSTIDRLLSRAKYASLPEVELFKAVYNWVKMKQEITLPNFEMDMQTRLKHYRSSMEPLLLKIRFLTMKLEELEPSVFKSNLLTNEEMQAIRVFILTDERKENFPKTISDDSTNRVTLSINDRSLFHYNNKDSTPCKHRQKITKYHLFKCEVFVNSDCFLTAVKLPIYHLNENGINVFFEIFVKPEINPFKSQSSSCDKKGIIHIKEPIFLIGNSTFLMSIRILESEMDIKNLISSNLEVYRYLENEYSNVLTEMETECTSSRFFCDAILYF